MILGRLEKKNKFLMNNSGELQMKKAEIYYYQLGSESIARGE